MPIALITGASRGLGLALARALAVRGWTLVVDARDPVVLADAVAQLRADGATVTAVPGDVADPGHRLRLATAATGSGTLDLLVNNASSLGAVPLPALARYPAEGLTRAWQVNVLAPQELTRLTLPALRAAGGVLVNLSSDAAVEAYPGWGGYGATKAALDRLTAVLGAEEPVVRCYAVDPGDLRTDLRALALPEEDPQDVPLPQTVVPALLRLVTGTLPSGRYRAADLTVPPGTDPAVPGGTDPADHRAVHPGTGAGVTR